MCRVQIYLVVLEEMEDLLHVGIYPFQKRILSSRNMMGQEQTDNLEGFHLLIDVEIGVEFLQPPRCYLVLECT